MGGSIRHGLRHLLDFRGRDGRALFWPYAGCVLGVWFVLGNAMFLGVMSWGVAQDLPYTTVVSLFFVVTAAAGALLVVFIAAAVNRRLHDRGMRGTWALVPLVLLISGFSLMSQLPLSASDPEPDLTLSLVVFANNAVYLACIVVLVLVLALPGQPGANRFGQSGDR